MFSSKQSLQLHEKRIHNEIIAEHKCKICQKTYNGMDAIMRHMSRMHKFVKSYILFRLANNNSIYLKYFPFSCREALNDVIEKAEKKNADNAMDKPSNGGRKKRTPDVIVNADVGDVVNIEHIELISADSQAPDTYKIICAGDTQDSVYEIFELPDTNSMKIEEMPTIPETAEEEEEEELTIFMDDEQLQSSVSELLKIVVDEDILSKFGYPSVDVDTVLTSVLQQCEQKPVDLASCADISTKIRENVKLLFTTVIGDDSIKEMLNNHTVDEVINHVITLAEV